MAARSPLEQQIAIALLGQEPSSKPQDRFFDTAFAHVDYTEESK